MRYKISLKCNRITLFIKFYTHKYTICIFTRQRSSNGVFHITAVEINMHTCNLHHSTFNAQTYKQHTHKKNGTHIHLYITTQTHLNLVPCLVWPNCRESTVIIRCNNLPQVVYNNLPQPWGKLLQFLVCLLLRNIFKMLTRMSKLLLILIRRGGHLVSWKKLWVLLFSFAWYASKRENCNNYSRPGPRFIKSFFSDKMVFERQNGFSATKIWLMGFSVKIRVS